MRISPVLLLLCTPAAAQTMLHWKGLQENAPFQSEAIAAPKAPQQARVKQWLAGKSHWLVDFRRIPTAADWASLRSGGVRRVGLVPDTGAIVYGPAFRPAPPARVRHLLPVEKISPLIRGSRRDGWFLVEFFPDVERDVARAIVLTEGWRMADNPYLAANHVLVEGDGANLQQLAQWDEVSYIFPASTDLIEGVPVYHCADDSVSGVVGQSIPLVGDGWDGPGLGAAALSYGFYNITAQLPSKDVRGVIASAFSQWSHYAAVSFTPVNTPWSNATIGILFATGAHGDGYPFGPAGGVLAHTFYPYPVNPESIAGDMHFNDANSWGLGADIDLFSVALHEAGHALGLGHSDLPGAVMYPYYRQVTGLSDEDIAAVLRLYAAVQTSPEPASQPSAPAPPAADPPKPDPPAPTPGAADTTPPSLTILSPESTSVYTSLSSLSLNGAATDNVGVTSVSWSSSIGIAGTASGTTQWEIQAIPLYQGLNTITVLASDAAGNSTWRVIVVRRQ
ncbi:MAG TPA: matrixin family metalloprotease [Bryobacteraceae bacterium]|jgi:hypothetical protein|nr:matrixin family metalloprotease [Bryobacteraceae bacterium]